MARIGQGAKRYFWRGFVLRFMSALPVVFIVLSTTGLGMETQNVQHYKLISTVEYAGEGQFRNQAVTMLTVTKGPLSGNEVQYSFTAKDPNSTSGQQASSMAFSFVIDKDTRRVSRATEDLTFWARVNNESVKSLKRVTRDNVGKTWKQSVDLSSLGEVSIEKLSFTLTAIQTRTGAFGEMIAVRALSEPFVVKIDKKFFRSKISTVYLFDPGIEDIYLSISVFEAAGDAGGLKETLRHEVATYRTDAAGVPVDLSDVGRDFEKLVAKLGLSQGSLEVVEESPLPQWALSQGLRAAQVANICSAAVCEGALNPVATVSIPIARVLESQRENARGGAGIFQRLVSGFGWNLPTAAIIGGAIAIPIAVSGGGGGGGHGVASPR
jgi:hypothetical protein